MTETEFVSKRLAILEKAFVELAKITANNLSIPVFNAVSTLMQSTAAEMMTLATEAQADPKLQASQIIHH